MKRLVTIIFNFLMFLILFMAMPFVFIYIFFITDYEMNKELFTGKELFKPWE